VFKFDASSYSSIDPQPKLRIRMLYCEFNFAMNFSPMIRGHLRVG